ncbi:NADH-quinone oxidoreductase subunit M [bacterium]|nr:NADH-quinone oxidoreductase subunit M [bacterium]
MDATNLNILSTLVFLPLFGAAVVALWPANDRSAWHVALYFSVGEFLLNLKVLLGFTPEYGGFQLLERTEWIRTLGVSYVLGIDGITLWLTLLTTALTPIVVLAAWGSIQKQIRAYLVSMLILEGAMIGSFLALDLILFFVFWEMMLIPMALLIGVWGGPRRIYSAVKFFLYTAFGSALMLVSILALAYLNYEKTGYLTFNYLVLREFSVEPGIALVLFIGFALAFAIKVPVVPFHTWLPDAHTEAPTGGSVILAGVLLKFGVYGFFRFCLPLFPDVALRAAPCLAGLGVVGIVYGALISMVQTDIKKLVAYSSVSHLGFCMLGLFSFTLEGMAGSVYVMLAHGVSTGALFLLVGFLYDRRHTREISDFGGITQVMPFYATAFVFTALASIGLPGLCGFVGEFLSLAGTFLSQSLPGARWLTAAAASGVILSAVYLLWMVQRVFFGEIRNDRNRHLADLTTRERCAILPLMALMVWMGVYPEPILSHLRPTLESLKVFVTIKSVQIDAEYGHPEPPRQVPEPQPGNSPEITSERAVAYEF